MVIAGHPTEATGSCLLVRVAACGSISVTTPVPLPVLVADAGMDMPFMSPIGFAAGWAAAVSAAARVRIVAKANRYALMIGSFGIERRTGSQVGAAAEA